MKHLPLTKQQKFHRTYARATALAALLLVASPTLAVRAEIRVEPCHSIQAAVDRASPGDRIIVLPGIFVPEGSATSASSLFSAAGAPAAGIATV